MTSLPSVLENRQLERFRAVVTRRLGLWFDDTRLAWLGEVLRRRMQSEQQLRAYRMDEPQIAELYLSLLEREPDPRELGALAQELTVGETYFFRNIEQFRALEEEVLPRRLEARSAQRCLRILSAGCASGEEPYSIAMTLRGRLPSSSWELSIHAVDLNPAALDKALRGRYSAWALRETPPEMGERWFRKDGRDHALDAAIRAAVNFEERNLCVEDPEFWQPGCFDVVFCRNVLMYFPPQVAQQVVARFARSLASGGYLFLGHAETLRGLTQDFDLCHTHGTFYYRRRAGAAGAAVAPAESTGGRQPDSAALVAAAVESSGTWVEAIGRAADRIRALTSPPPPMPVPDLSDTAVHGRFLSPAPEYWEFDGPSLDERAGRPLEGTAGQLGSGRAPGRPLQPGADVQQALSLFRNEQYAEALGLVRSLPAETARDPDVLLLHAVLLAHRGDLAEAEQACRALLALDALNAGAHYVLALCREGAGDLPGAADCDQTAAYLDPAFAMPRLHLGLLARRAGDHETVRRELGQALQLLSREDPSRLLLFGGGFNRDTLLSLCRSELLACGGAIQ